MATCQKNIELLDAFSEAGNGDQKTLKGKCFDKPNFKRARKRFL